MGTILQGLMMRSHYDTTREPSKIFWFTQEFWGTCLMFPWKVRFWVWTQTFLLALLRLQCKNSFILRENFSLQSNRFYKILHMDWVCCRLPSFQIFWRWILLGLKSTSFICSRMLTIPGNLSNWLLKKDSTPSRLLLTRRFLGRGELIEWTNSPLKWNSKFSRN